MKEGRFVLGIGLCGAGIATAQLGMSVNGPWIWFMVVAAGMILAGFLIGRKA
jgi:hypothetical protein